MVRTFGRFPKQKDVLTAYLKKDEEKSLVRILDRATPGTEKIITEYEVLEEHGEESKAKILSCAHSMYPAVQILICRFQNMKYLYNCHFKNRKQQKAQIPC